MNPAAFFALPEVRRILERAGRGAGVPLSIHALQHNQEGPQVVGWNGCAACAYVSEVPRGRWACRASRRDAAQMALAQQRPLSFICHLGFACVTAPAVPDEAYLLTFGPYMPAASGRTLEFDVRKGLGELGVDLDEADGLPFALDDIHHAPPDALPAIAEWCIECLTPLWEAWCAAQEDAEAPSAEAADLVPARVAKRVRTLPLDGRVAEDMAAALAGGNQPQARALLRGRLEEYQSASRPKIALLRARVVRLVSDALEAVERAGLGSAAAWDAFPAFIAAARVARKEAELLDAAMLVLGIIKRKAVKNAPATAPGYAKLNALLNERLSAKVTLEEAAAVLGLSPSALSHRLRRKFNMNFSQYMGRLRIDKAKELLRRTQLSAREIARRVGVADQSHFSKLFRKFEGLAPSEYRKRHGSSS